MIVSHKHRFIFIHGPKTAGTTMADALKPICGPEDIIIQHRWKGINKHEDSQGIYDFVGKEVWDSYYKFTFERNPWDKMVSLYCMQIDPDHWQRKDVSFWTQIRDSIRRRQMQKNPPSFRKWLLGKHESKLHSGLPTYNGKLYFTEGPLAADFIGKFENLREDFRKITEHIGVDIELPEGKRAQRRKADPDFDPNIPSYRKYYDEELKQIIADTYSKEIEHLGYTF